MIYYQAYVTVGTHTCEINLYGMESNLAINFADLCQSNFRGSTVYDRFSAKHGEKVLLVLGVAYR